jgi:hypothetical protein
VLYIGCHRLHACQLLRAVIRTSCSATPREPFAHPGRCGTPVRTASRTRTFSMHHPFLATRASLYVSLLLVHASSTMRGTIGCNLHVTPELTHTLARTICHGGAHLRHTLHARTSPPHPRAPTAMALRARGIHDTCTPETRGVVYSNMAFGAKFHAATAMSPLPLPFSIWGTS